MRLRKCLLFVGVAASVGWVFADGIGVKSYTVVPPLQPGFVRFSRPVVGIVSNDWMNGAYVPSGGVATNVAETVAGAANPNQARYRLEASEVGFIWERSKPEYYLSDRVTPPKDVDWNRTREEYDRLCDELAADGDSPGFLLNPDPNNLCVYAIQGGSQAFTWYLKDGSAVTNRYTIGATCSGRPRRIYWTDPPYNAPTINMQGKFVRIFDNGGVTKVVKSTVTNIVGGVENVQENAVISGVYVDETAQVMFAKGRPRGQFVLVYYDTGSYNQILHVEVIEVSEPIATTAFGTIGEKLEPTGLGYDLEGLSPYVTAGIGDSDDNRGDYLYQPAGQYSYSPKNDYVYPLRPSVGVRWKAEIYWMETDPMGVQWPFELDQYENDWPERGNLYVRGDKPGDAGAKIYIPDDYTAELGGYQEPEGHALAVEGDCSFRTVGEGWSLVKLTTEDNVWFLPIHSVLRTNADYFTLEPCEVQVGQEFRVRGGVRSGLQLGAREVVNATDEVPGYIYRAASGTQYNPHLYRETTNATASAVADGTVPSAIFAVNTGDTDIEVWWSRRVQEEDMPSWIDIPTLPQVYRPVWPDAQEAPTIVIASQRGSGGESLFHQYGAATFDKRTASLELMTRAYFPNGTGTIGFWTRPRATDDPVDGPVNAPSALLQLGTREGKSLAFRIGEGERLQLLVNGVEVASVRMPELPRPNVWTHIALALTGGGKFILYVNAKEMAGGSLPDAGFLAGMLDRNFAGWEVNLALAQQLKEGEDIDLAALGEIAAQMTFASPGRQLAEITMRSVVLSVPELDEARVRLLRGSEAGVTGYHSFRPGEDLLSEHQIALGMDARHFRERTTGFECRSFNVGLDTPGAPCYRDCVIAADSMPRVYYENDEKAIGFNPNDEHAFVTAGAGGYLAWALRGDLNLDGRPAVLVEYEHDGAAKMQFYHVAVTNSLWPALADDCTAGKQLPGPLPLTQMSDPWLPEDWWEPDPANPGLPGPCYRDRKGQLWARAAGTLPIYMYYRMQEGFWFPQYDADDQPAVGTAVPWLSVFGNGKCAADPLAGEPACWTWTVEWPEEANEMKIGQTLYEAADGLPGVYNMKSVALVYPSAVEESGPTETVALTDPTAMQSVEFDYAILGKLGLTTDPNGGLSMRKGKYYFTELPPHLSNRIWVESTAGTKGMLCLVGEWAKKNAGVSVLYVNVLSAAERQQLLDVVPESMRKGDDYSTWCMAVERLGAERVTPNDMRTVGAELKTTYWPRDSYALTAMGGTNWVVLVENDAPTTNEVRATGETVNLGVSEGDPVNMHVFRVVPEYYTGRIVTKEDEQNLLSQRLTVMYTESFAGDSELYEFEWKSCSPNADGTIPDDYEGAYALRAGYADEKMPRITIGEQGDTLDNMVNKYWICRYRAIGPDCPAYATMGTQWSGWCAPPALAEGWVQRVLNNVTPFNQLMTDLFENEAETVVSMIQKAGKPYTGDVAFNQDALKDSGLIQLYETLLNKAESMSILLGVKSTDANKQLQLAAERLGELYTLLGDEAYSDAKNPTVGFGEKMELMDQIDFGSAASSLFCFDNQVSSLLDEELCLLRGRSGASAPVMTIGPYYNRLLWNFTKGVTAGEVAYAVNYNIEGTETVALSEEQAAALYPQGHGDAYGHYLSALKGWYRLMRNPNFDWVRAQGEMNIADAAANVDYHEEAKFAGAALKVARTAADVVDLTARKAYDDKGGKMAGYRDEKGERAFGYGEWANRGGYGALVNWAVANSLLPAAPDAGETGFDELFADEGLKRIDRGTVDELAEICAVAEAIQLAEDRVDAGLNPLGLSENAIPFDISPIGANDGTMTHFEQIRERAGTAVKNARTVLHRAQEYSSRLRMLQEAGDEYEDMIEEEEMALTEELIGYYGTPYPGDIGPGKTYVQGYEGPDLVHYAWMDLSRFGLANFDSDTVTVEMWPEYAKKMDYASLRDTFDDGSIEVKVSIARGSRGVVVKPATITGERLRQGSIQEKYSDFLVKYKAYTSLITVFNAQLDGLEADMGYNEAIFVWKESMLALKQALDAFSIFGATKNFKTQITLNSLDAFEKNDRVVSESTEDLAPEVTGAGMTVVVSPKGVVSASLSPTKIAKAYTAGALTAHVKNSQARTDMIGAILKSSVDAVSTGLNEFELEWGNARQLKGSIAGVNAAAVNVQNAANELNQAIDAYNAEVAKAEAVLDRREALRRKWVNKLSQMRYNDMFFRLVRNQSLARYTAAFDLAQKYVWEAAKAYDYETTLLSADAASGEAFLNQIIASRSLGSFDVNGEPVVGNTGDTGLAGLLAQMDANWLVLKPRLGINNPQPYATWFSLRGERFRILPGEAGDRAWAKELTKHWVEDIKANDDFIRYCQPFVSQFGLKDKEPGLIIPFETTIDFAKNFFGEDLAGDDHAYDSSWYATRIYAAGVWFDGYNAKAEGASATVKPALANTPVCYLVPMGRDCLRVPGLDEGEAIAYNVVDQVIPAPYAIGSTHLNDPSWFPSASQGDLGGADATTKIRRHPSFRAYFDPAGGEPTDERLDCTRLVGRSAWNTRWMLVIPAGSMNADREKALSVFVNGSDVNRDGKLDLKPVSDIRIGFKTYSNSGN